MVEKEKYFESIKKLINRNIAKEKLQNAIESDFKNGKISEILYKEAIEFLKIQIIEKLGTTTYTSKEDAEKALGIKIEGHKIMQIDGLEEVLRNKSQNSKPNNIQESKDQER